MILHALGLLSTFILTAVFSAGVTLAPMSVAWGSIWVYLTFILMMIPGYILAVISLFIVTFSLAALGIGAGVGVIAASEAWNMRRK
jgi:hypothetical protein